MREFSSIEALAAHLVTTTISNTLQTARGLSKCAQLVERRAKEKIGSYQDQAGPFIAWPELADSTKRDRERRGYSENEPLLRTGDLRDSISSAVSIDSMEAQIGSNSDVAVYQELGTTHLPAASSGLHRLLGVEETPQQSIPPRSFLGGAMVDCLPEIKRILGMLVVSFLIGDAVIPGGIRIEE